MALLDELWDVAGEDVGWVRRVEGALAEQPEASGRYFDHYADHLGMDVELVRSVRTPPHGVHAVGLIASDDGWRPGMLVMRELAPESEPGRPVPALEFSGLRDFLVEVADVDPARVGVIGIDPPRDEYESVHGALWGTLGLPVHLGGGGEGALTAGHVAPSLGATVTLGCGLTGTVVFSDHRANYTARVACADVAAIQLPPGWMASVPVPPGLQTGAHTELKTLEAYNRSGTGAGGRIVRFAGDRFTVREDQGAWGDFAMADPISVEGDSGAVAVAQDGRIAGQVVGGLSGAYSIVQTMTYLLHAARALPAV